MDKRTIKTKSPHAGNSQCLRWTAIACILSRNLDQNQHSINQESFTQQFDVIILRKGWNTDFSFLTDPRIFRITKLGKGTVLGSYILWIRMKLTNIKTSLIITLSNSCLFLG